jgi:hypothetical protein
MRIESFPFGTNFPIGAIYESVLFVDFFIFVAWFDWVTGHKVITFLWPAQKPIFENTINWEKILSISVDPESHRDIHPTNLKSHVAHRIVHAAFC